MEQTADSYVRNERGMSPLERVFERTLQNGDSSILDSVGEKPESFESRLHSSRGPGEVWQPDQEEGVYRPPGAPRIQDDDTYVDVSFADDLVYPSQWQATPLADPESSKVQRNEPGPISAREAKPSNAPPVTHDHEGLVHIYNKLSLLDRHLFVWILVVMATALLVGYYNPEVKEHLEVITVGSISLPIAIGLWVMLFPVLCKVRFELLGEMLRGSQLRSNLLLSLALNWVVGPALMTGLAWATLPDLPTYRTGVILIGIARCIAMVLIWNDLAKGDAELCAVLVSFNSVLQILLFTPFSIFYLRVVSGRSGVDVSIKTVSNSVLFFLGIPFAAAVVTRLSLRHGQGAKWYDTRFVPFIAPWALLGLLYTIFLMFSVQAHEIVFNIVRLCRVAVPLLLYFVIMFSSATAVCKWMKLPYAQLVTHSFTAASNNFELAIAVAIGTFGIDSHEALAATIGPLIEVPVLLALVYLTLHLKRKNII